MKKLFSFVLVLTMLCTMCATAFAAEEEVVLTALFFGDSSAQSKAFQDIVDSFNALDKMVLSLKQNGWLQKIPKPSYLL